jgi:hypothetical protein
MVESYPPAGGVPPGPGSQSFAASGAVAIRLPSVATEGVLRRSRTAGDGRRHAAQTLIRRASARFEGKARYPAT